MRRNIFCKAAAWILLLCLIFTGCGKNADPAGAAADTSAAAAASFAQAKPAPASSDDPQALSVHYIDVGQADSILIKVGDHAMLIDAGNNDDGDFVVDYLREQGIEKLDYLVGTHPHEDHIGGLDNVIKAFDIEKILMPKIQSNTKTFEDVLDAVAEKEMKISSFAPGDQFTLGEAEFTALGPTKTYDDANNNSIVLKMVYGKTSFLFTGDMETKAEEDILNNGADVSAQVLKVGHHGSSTSSGINFLKKVSPEYAVISVEENNSYGHPHKEILQRLSNLRVQTLRTDECGTIIFTSDGETLTVNQDIKPSKAPVASQPSGTVYIGNKNSLKFHKTTCSGLPKEENRVTFSTRQEAIDSGYEPCGKCKP